MNKKAKVGGLKTQSDEEKKLRVGQLCFSDGQHMYCNFVVRNGKIVKRLDEGWFKFPNKFKSRPREKNKM